MGNFQIIENGLMIEPYKSQLSFKEIDGENTQRSINGNKAGLIVKISASNKPDKTFYHEVEWKSDGSENTIPSIPIQAQIDSELKKLADDYEAS